MRGFSPRFVSLGISVTDSHQTAIFASAHNYLFTKAISLWRTKFLRCTGKADMPKTTSAIVYSNLQQFSFYSETIFALIEHYKQNKVKV